MAAWIRTVLAAAGLLVAAFIAWLLFAFNGYEEDFGSGEAHTLPFAIPWTGATLALAGLVVGAAQRTITQVPLVVARIVTRRCDEPGADRLDSQLVVSYRPRWSPTRHPTVPRPRMRLPTTIAPMPRLWAATLVILVACLLASMVIAITKLT